MTDDKQIAFEQDGKMLAQATVSAADDEGAARAQVHMAAGQLPVGTRQKVADAVHEAVVQEHATHLTATVPCGDVELVEGIGQHLEHVELRAAGATSIIRGDVGPS